MQDLLAKKAIRYYYGEKPDGTRYRKYFQTNSDALRAFQSRREHGMNLSAKVWNQSDGYVKELECAISAAIEKGMSAVTLSKRLSKYLNDFPSLKADYGERYGHAVDCTDCEYRSVRLARSEINMAYRTAEQQRWRQFDFIIGYEIKMSGSHPKRDICDELVGKYPKDFVFTGWHPNCMCYCVPIVMSEDDYWKMRESGISPVQQVSDLPETFKDYVRDNQGRIERGRSRGTVPYWVRDNAARIDGALKPSDWRITDDEIGRLDNFGSFTAKAYNGSAMKGYNLPRFDEGMTVIGDSAEIYWKSKSVSFFKNGNATMSYNGVTEDGGRVELAREFRRTPQGVEVNHTRFFLPEGMQGKGIAKEMFREMFREYGDMRVSRVNVKANADVGGYAWAKYGFCATRSEVESLLQRAAGSRITREQYEEALSIVKMYGNDVFPMNLLANLPYGEKMLKGESWQGFLDFSDREQVKFMKEYVGYPK
jgi:hypothetical protein